MCVPCEHFAFAACDKCHMGIQTLYVTLLPHPGRITVLWFHLQSQFVMCVWPFYRTTYYNYQKILSIARLVVGLKPGGYLNYFWRSVRCLKPFPISNDFSRSNNGWFDVFLRNFRKSGPISKGFFCLKNGWFYLFFQFWWNGTLF